MTSPKMRLGGIVCLATVGLAALVVPPIVFAPLYASSAAGNDFEAVVSTLEQHYSTHAERVPMMGFVSFCAHVWSVGGVKGMRIAEFDNLPQSAGDDPAQLEQLVTSTLGSDWQRMITERDARGSVTLIFVRPDDKNMRMLIADYDNGELDLVRLELNPDRMQHWLRDPENAAHNHHQNKNNFD